MPISAPSISAAGNGYDEGGVFVFDGDPSFHWSVEGEVASFTATLYDSQGNVVHSGGVGGNSLNIGASNLEPGSVYTLEVVAQPASGGEATVSHIRLPRRRAGHRSADRDPDRSAYARAHLRAFHQRRGQRL